MTPPRVAGYEIWMEFLVLKRPLQIRGGVVNTALLLTVGFYTDADTVFLISIPVKLLFLSVVRKIGSESS